MKKIPLTKGKFALIDDCDFDLISKHKYHYVKGGKTSKNGYANYTIFDKEFWKKNKKTRTKGFRMHNIIMNPPEGMIVDHINHDGLDNRRVNLRICTQKENLYNRQKNINREYKGVHINKYKFYAAVRKDGKLYYKGGFNTQKEAAIEYNKMATELFGEFANLNKI